MTDMELSLSREDNISPAAMIQSARHLHLNPFILLYLY